ncbi:MAG TPA: D-Ala-D-Ala carboxypeptidase family metallohydrolase [Gemmatimonadales bacterium]|nr:D-Ala-D-Ala carboxypeptidase family metallohydrolase [Gemmatimonadales bacterium]
MSPLSRHWTLDDLIKTSHPPNIVTGVVRYGVPLTTDVILANLQRLAETLLDPLFDYWGWQVSSCYRSPAVNAIVGGSNNSAHTAGLACDGGPSQGRGGFADVIRWFDKSSMPFDRLIFEARSGGHRWLHVQAPRAGDEPLRLFFSSPKPDTYLRMTADVLAGVAG